ncbi:MAG: hypothetical protein ABIV28_08000 [Longimicrobiales bacterium]
MNTRIALAVLVGLTLLSAVPAPSAGQQAPPPPMVPRAQPPLPRRDAKRDALEAQVLNRFLNRASDDVGLDGAQRTRVGEIVRASGLRRRALNGRSVELHRRFQVAIRTADTPPATFSRLLADHQALRSEEQQIAETEQAELKKVLSPRQQAHFLMLWIRLQENARQIQAQRPGPPPGGN